MGGKGCGFVGFLFSVITSKSGQRYNRRGDGLASEVTATLGAVMGTSVGFLTKEAGEDQGKVQETMVHKGATSVWYFPN